MHFLYNIGRQKKRDLHLTPLSSRLEYYHLNSAVQMYDISYVFS